MYAVIRAGGHQEKVSAGELITLDRLKQAVGEEVTFVPLLIAKPDGTVVSDKKVLQDSAKVVGLVREHLKGDKVDIFQYRQKTGYRRHVGHRQPLTLVEIAEIHLGEEVARAPEPAVEEPAPADEATEEEKPKAKAGGKKAPAKKAAAKKAPAKKAPAKG